MQTEAVPASVVSTDQNSEPIMDEPFDYKSNVISPARQWTSVAFLSLVSSLAIADTIIVALLA